MTFDAASFMSGQATGGEGGENASAPPNPSGDRVNTLQIGNFTDALKTGATAYLTASAFGASGKTSGKAALIAGGLDLLSGGKVSSVLFGTGGEGADTPTGSASDWRVRISMATETAGMFYNGGGVMSPLSSTNGLVFPTTPTVTVNHAATYNSTQLTHNNYKSYFYQGSDVQGITITGDFTAQTIAEGKYVNAAIHFLRACTKMFFGTNTQYAGNPPPMVFLNGYGGTYLPNVPCVVTTFSHTMPNDVDYIQVESYWMPVVSSISVTLQPVYSRSKQLLFDNGAYNGGNPYSGGSGGFI
jgi:hypothetical protein